MPDILLLGNIAAVLDCDINGLMGYSYSRKQISYYEDKYDGDEYYWETAPSNMCLEIIRPKTPVRKYRVLDVGSGEGKNAVFFARNGYEVDAYDISDAGVEKTKRLAERCRTQVNVFRANILDYRLEREYDIIFSSGVFHYIPDALHSEVIADFQNQTSTDGIHAINIFVRKPFIHRAPENESCSTVWKSGELALYYTDWLLHEMLEIIFDCNSSGIPHKHCIDKLLSQKVE